MKLSLIYSKHFKDFWGKTGILFFKEDVEK